MQLHEIIREIKRDRTHQSYIVSFRKVWVLFLGVNRLNSNTNSDSTKVPACLLIRQADIRPSVLHC